MRFNLARLYQESLTKGGGGLGWFIGKLGIVMGT